MRTLGWLAVTAVMVIGGLVEYGSPVRGAKGIEAGVEAAAIANGETPPAIQAVMAHLYEEVRAGGDGGLVIDNGVYRASFSAAGGVVYTPRFGGALESRLTWRYRARTLAGGASTQRLDAVAPVIGAAGDHTVEFTRPGLLERYEGERGGLVQSFLLPGRPAGSGDVRMAGDLAFDGPAREIDGTLAFDAGRGLPVFTYARPVAFDAAHVPVPVRVDVARRSLTLVVDGAALDRAQWPVTIVPRFGTGLPESAAPPWSDVSRNYARRELLVVYAAAAGASGSEVRGRRYDDAGRALDSSFTIVDGGTDALLAPRVAYDPRVQRYLVVWGREHGPVEGVLLDAFGNATGRPFVLPRDGAAAGAP